MSSVHQSRVTAALLFILGVGGCALAAAGQTEPYPASDAEWTLKGGGSYEQHFSKLDQINTATVKGLKLAWYADMPTADGMSGIPLVADGVVYQSGSLGKVFANDVRTGKLLWTFDAEIKFPLGLLPSWGSRQSRGLAVWEDKVIRATGDCRLIALDRRTGTKQWEAQSCEPTQFRTITGAPRVGAGKVFIGNANADTGIGRGFVDAFEVATGKHLWRFYTVPGDPGKGFENAAMEMASKTWGKEYWKNTGGGSAWEGMTYDPVTNLLYIGTGGPAPFNPLERGEGAGDELFTNAIVAVKADTGEYVWHYTVTPHDAWNLEATMPVVLADLSIKGVKRHVVMTAPKNGFFYVLDARTGKLLNEPKPFVPVNWASRIDMATGKPVYMDDAKYWLKGSEGAVVTPTDEGAHSWMPMSYNPGTGMIYIPVIELSSRMALEPPNAQSNPLGNVVDDHLIGLSRNLPFKGSLLAWDPIAQRERWRRDIGPPFQGGVLSTAGKVVFQGTTTGKFIAYHADSGQELWSFETGSRVVAGPSTVKIDGEQLILVAAGSASTSAVGLIPQLVGRATGPARLLAFSLRGNAQLPAAQKAQPFPKPIAPEPDPTLVSRGKGLWNSNLCVLCHGKAAGGTTGSIPDLRRITAARYGMFSQIVRGGLLKDAGMPIFADALSEEDLPALKAFIMSEAWKAYRAYGEPAKEQ